MSHEFKTLTTMVVESTCIRFLHDREKKLEALAEEGYELRSTVTFPLSHISSTTMILDTLAR